VSRQRAVYEAYAERTSSFGEDQTIASNEPAEIAERLAASALEVGADALNLRVQLPGMVPEDVREQISAIGTAVVALLKRDWSSPAESPR
jgi:hypothetical protein